MANNNTILALKWRPQSFAEVQGQNHVVTALSNALNRQRLHHAYLFTGTSGVGKTSIARILAKCLNCEQGVSATPCNKCESCHQIQLGKAIDLIEVDAASRTRVEDTRELLDNVQYLPTVSRYKIYLIDEVHMLSGHSFNALLKTLEEPPKHVIFLLATTDPQKLPITILSRCLQFHLKAMATSHIEQQLELILKAENITWDKEALKPLCHAAKGSMRDALSLVEQAIAYSDGYITMVTIQAMLGLVPQEHCVNLLRALSEKSLPKILEIISELARLNADFNFILEDCALLLHQIALRQMLPDDNPHLFENCTYASDIITELANAFTKEDVQLYYQIAIISKKDLNLAPNPQSGFEMTLLRMLAFTPNKTESTSITATTTLSNPSTDDKDDKKDSADNSKPNWTDIIPQLNLSGVAFMLAYHGQIKQWHNDNIHLEIDPKQKTLLNPQQQQILTDAIQNYVGRAIPVTVTIGDDNLLTPARYEQQQREQEKNAAMNLLKQDKHAQCLAKEFGAAIEIQE